MFALAGNPNPFGCGAGQKSKVLIAHRVRGSLIVAAVLGFEGALIALGASEAAKAKPAPPSAFRVEMAKPPYCSIKTPDRLFFL
jgi:hypothetical protein